MATIGTMPEAPGATATPTLRRQCSARMFTVRASRRAHVASLFRTRGGDARRGGVAAPAGLESLRCMEARESATALLLQAGSGDADAVARVFPLIYDELRRVAHRHLERESTGHTLATTELVHEAYLKLIDQTRVQWAGHAHFMAIAATAMRRILVDRARARGSLKR